MTPAGEGRRTLADAVEAVEGMPFYTRDGIECTLRVYRTIRMDGPTGRAFTAITPVGEPTAAGKCTRAYRTIGTPRVIHLTESMTIEAVIFAFGSVHSVDRFLAGEGVGHA